MMFTWNNIKFVTLNWVMKRHYKIRVSGRVQGVGFRYAAKNQAASLKLNGQVQNQPDGSVYVEIEGDKHACHEFIRWCRKGPGFGWVEKVDYMEGELAGFDSFSVRF